MTVHEQLKKKAKEAVQALFSDTTVDQETTEESLGEIADDIQIMIESMHEG